MTNIVFLLKTCKRSITFRSITLQSYWGFEPQSQVVFQHFVHCWCSASSLVAWLTTIFSPHLILQWIGTGSFNSPTDRDQISTFQRISTVSLDADCISLIALWGSWKMGSEVGNFDKSFLCQFWSKMSEIFHIAPLGRTSNTTLRILSVKGGGVPPKSVTPFLLKILSVRGGGSTPGVPPLRTKPAN